jgi:hypothetical protein
MTDIDATQRSVLTGFGVYQMRFNPGGIGNECTHWIYAALFEARALDSDRASNIQQVRIPYVWGRAVPPSAAQRGDIAQYHHGFESSFGIGWLTAGGDPRWNEATRRRGPQFHTGMLFTSIRRGAFGELESHLHSAGTPVMSIRYNTIYSESFAVAVSAADLAKLKGTDAWPANVDLTNDYDAFERVDWIGLRDKYTINLAQGKDMLRGLKASKVPNVGGGPLGVVFWVETTGDLNFHAPQLSTARMNMTSAQLAAEKAQLIRMLLASGRPGADDPSDPYHADSKAQRRGTYFDWTFPRPWY